MKFEPIHTPPSVEEIESRIARVQQKMDELNLDYYVAHDPKNIFYLTNFSFALRERPFVLLIPKQGNIRFIIRELEVLYVQSRAVGSVELVPYREFPAPEGESWNDRVRDIIGKSERVGVEATCPLQVYEAVNAERVQADIIDDIRMTKSEYEIGRLVYAAQLVNETMADFLANAHVGRTMQEASSAGSSLILKRLLQDEPNMDISAFKPLCVFQPVQLTHDPHNITDFGLRMDVGGPHVTAINGNFNGYTSEIERNFFLGHVPEEAKRPYEVMMQARQLSFDLTKPGNRVDDVDRQVIDFFTSKGYGSNLLARTGHGMGVSGHEAPYLAEGDNREIQPGMCFSIEPGIYFRGLGGFRHSDTVITTEDGNVSLTSAPDTLEELTLQT
jgi:Xaa-Pro dipeptidase